MPGDFDSFMKVQPNGEAAPPAGDFDAFMQQQQTPAAPVASSVHPALAGLPQPSEAAQAAALNAQQIATKLTQFGQFMQQNAQAQIPHALRGYTPQELAQPVLDVGPRGLVTQRTMGDKLAAEGTIPGGDPLHAVLNSPMLGGRQMTEGVEQTADAHTGREVAGGVGKVVAGGFQAATPLLAAGGITAPLETAAGLVAGSLTQTGTEAALKKVGVPDEYAGLAGDAAGLIGGGLAAHGAGKWGPRPAINADQVLPPEQQPAGRRLEGETSEATPAQGKQPINSPNAGSPAFDQFMKQRQAAAVPPKPSAASRATVDVTPETAEAQQVPKTEGVTNDNRTDISVGRPEQPTAQEAQEKGGSVEQASGQGVEPARTVDQGRTAEVSPGSDANAPDARAVEPTPRPPSVAPAYGNDTEVRVPGEKTSYPARYAVRESADVQPSHNPFNFEPNPNYEHQNDRDYSQSENAARVVENGQPGTFDPAYTVEASPTAEHGSPVIDQRGNVLGGNSRTMTQQRVYEQNPAGADAYRQRLAAKASEFGIAPEELARFQKPQLVRELANTPTAVGAQNAITDFNKTAAAKLAPEEQAVSDGRRLSPRTISKLSGNLADVGDSSTLAQALSGDKGDEILESLVTDGVITRQEKNGMVDERGQLTAPAKERIAKALVGRLFETPADYGRTAPEVRNKLERIAPQVLRVEGRPEWAMTEPVRGAVAALAEAKAHGIKNLNDLAQQAGLNGETKAYSPEALAVAKVLQSGPQKVYGAFRQYANDAELSREGAQAAFFEPPTRKEAFDSAFGEQQKAVTALASRSKEEIAIHPLPGAPEVYKLGQRTDYHLLRTKAQQIKLPPGHAARTLAVGVNKSGMEVLGRMGKDAVPDDAAQSVGGSYLNAANAAVVARNLEIQMRAYQAHRPSGVVELQRLALQAAAEHKGLVVYKHHAGRAPVLAQTIMREELNHAAQDELVSGSGIERGHLGSRAVDVTTSHYGHIAARTLGGKGYKNDPHLSGHMAAEIGVRLMDSGREGELGLTLAEARTLAAQYVRSLRKEYGHARPREIIRKVFDALRRTDRGSEKQPGSLPDGVRPEGRSGSAGGVGTDTSSAPQADTVRASGVHGEPPARAGTARLSAQPKERSLFSDAENEDVATTAASDRAKLEGQRLTAQLKAPMTGAEQRKGLKKPKSAQSDLFGGEQGEPLQGTLFSRELSEEDEAKLNYSGMGALEDVAVRNLSQLRRAAVKQAQLGPQFAVKDKTGNVLHKGSASEIKDWVKEQGENPDTKGVEHWKVSEVHDPWSSTVEAAAWKSQAATALHVAVPRIEKAMGGEWHMQDLQRGLIESNLIGKRQRWRNMADFAQRASEDNLTKSLPRLMPLLDVVRDRLGLPRNLADAATALANNGDYDSLRKLLHENFTAAAGRVASVMSPGEFQSMSASSTMDSARKIYKSEVEAPMARAHGMNEGVFQDATGPWDTYYPLTPVTAEDAAQAKLGSVRGYASPSNKANRFATGLSEDYDDSMEALRGKLMTAVRDGTKAAALGALEDNGILTRVGPFEDAPAQIVYAGQAYNGVKLEMAGPRTIITDGKVTKIPATYGVIPEPFEKELRPVFEKERFTKNHALALLEKVNGVAIAGPADAIFHSVNLGATVAWNAPFALPALVSRAYTQGFGQIANEFRKMIDTDSLSEANAPALMRLARVGALSDRFGSETYSKRYSEQMGSERHLTSGPWLYGPKGVDVRARLFMHNLATALNPDISDHDLHMWVNQLGTYSAALQSAIVRGAKKTRLAPFAEAGMRMSMNGVNTWTGRGPMPVGAMKGEALRAYRLLTTGAIAAVATWILQQKAYTGKYPWEDKRARLFELPVNHAERYSKLGRARWGNGAETGYIKTTAWNPLVMRGARALGIKGAVDTKLGGGTNWQALEAAEKDILNTWAHPFLGPIPRALVVGLTGDEPYLTGLRDDRAQYNPQLMPAVKNPGGTAGALKRPLAGVRELNPLGFDAANAGITSLAHFFGNTAYHSGIGEKSTKGEEWFRMLTDYVLPGILGEAQNPARKTAFLKRQARSAARQK